VEPSGLLEAARAAGSVGGLSGGIFDVGCEFFAVAEPISLLVCPPVAAGPTGLSGLVRFGMGCESFESKSLLEVTCPVAAAGPAAGLAVTGRGPLVVAEPMSFLEIVFLLVGAGRAGGFVVTFDIDCGSRKPGGIG
jgi:hypothetical protein